MDPSTGFGSAKHTITMRLMDSCGNFTDYKTAVEVNNTAPKFAAGFKIDDINIPMNSVTSINLSGNINDIDGDQINVTLT
jgi:hypothetical protein